MAKLARLSFSDEELDRLQAELGAITASFATLAQVDTTGVAETVQAVHQPARLRPDEPGASLPQSAVTQNAPDEFEGFFRVPAAIKAAADEPA